MDLKRWIANGFTLANLVLGFVSLIFINSQDYFAAALLIFIATIMDGLDGRVARKLGTSSDFGKELDSLCDLVSFGVAPALLLYYTSLINFGVFGLAASVIFPICGAFRLARFNIQSPGSFFTGIPITVAGGTLASIILSGRYMGNSIYVFIVFGLAYLMVSNVKYPNFKGALKKQSTKFLVFATVFGLFLVYRTNPGQVIFLCNISYVISGMLFNTIMKTNTKLNLLVKKMYQ